MLTLDVVSSNFDKWRSQGNNRGKIPEELWLQVLELTEHYPASKVTRTLGITNSQLNKKRSQCLTADVNSAFVELPIKDPDLNHSPGFTGKIELKRTDGVTIVIDEINKDILMQVLTKFMREI